MKKNLIHGSLIISVCFLFFIILGCEDLGLTKTQGETGRAASLTPIIYEHTINGYTGDSGAIVLPFDGPIYQKARSNAPAYFVSVVRSDAYWNTYGTEIMENFGSNDIALIEQGAFSVKGFCDENNFTLVKNTYYRIKFATHANIDGSWVEITRLVYLADSLIPIASSNQSNGLTITSSGNYSSEYEPWKAFDGDGENGWSRWISKRNPNLKELEYPILNYEWIDVEFDEPIAPRYLYLLSEYSSNIKDRMPKHFSLTGYYDNSAIYCAFFEVDFDFWEDHLNGVVLDLNTSGPVSRIRLSIVQTCGSDVVALRSIKLLNK